ncbi:MAG: uroporphyrinogen decarboxylase family protein [Candidatus Hodarchaeales archaeon]|jgi:hypothetical protein
MNSKERVLTAFQHQEPDKVPLFEGWIEPEIVNLLGCTDQYTVREKLGLDCFPIGRHPKNSKAYGNGIDEWGRIFKHGEYGGGLVNNNKTLNRYSPPLAHAQDWFPREEIRNTKKKYGEDYALFFAWHDCSLGLTYLRMGMENFFRRIYENPEFVKILIENSTEWVIALVKEANHEDVDFILLGDDVADNSRPFISPKMFREFLLPEYKKIVESSDVPIIWHSDGNVIPLIPMIIEAGFAGIHSLEPKANIDLQIVKKEFGDKLVLSGNLDTTDVLCQSNLDIIREDVARCIRSGAPNGGYLFSSSNSLFKGHKVEAIQEAYKYVKEINQYPIDI